MGCFRPGADTRRSSQIAAIRDGRNAMSLPATWIGSFHIYGWLLLFLSFYFALCVVHFSKKTCEICNPAFRFMQQNCRPKTRLAKMNLKAFFQHLSKWLDHALLRVGRFFVRFCIGATLLSSFVALFIVIEHYATNYQFKSIGFVVLTPLALLIGFSGLMYNRARAVGSRVARFRSLYAAERLMTSSCFYLVALVTGFIVTVFLQPFGAANTLPSRYVLFLIYTPVMLFGGWAFGELMFALFTITPSPSFRNQRRVARYARRLL